MFYNSYRENLALKEDLIRYDIVPEITGSHILATSLVNFNFVIKGRWRNRTLSPTRDRGTILVDFEPKIDMIIKQLSSLLELEPSFLPLMRWWTIGCHYSWTLEFDCFGENCVDINIWVILQ